MDVDLEEVGAILLKRVRTEGRRIERHGGIREQRVEGPHQLRAHCVQFSRGVPANAADSPGVSQDVLVLLGKRFDALGQPLHSSATGRHQAG